MFEKVLKSDVVLGIPTAPKSEVTKGFAPVFAGNPYRDAFGRFSTKLKAVRGAYRSAVDQVHAHTKRRKDKISPLDILLFAVGKEDTAPEYANILKANPYHDERGRFATKDGAKFVSVGPKFTSNGFKVVAYHGSEEDFTKFDINKLKGDYFTNIMGLGLYFASKKEVAEVYKAGGGKLFTVELGVDEKSIVALDEPLKNNATLFEAQKKLIPAIEAEYNRVFVASAAKKMKKELASGAITIKDAMEHWRHAGDALGQSVRGDVHENINARMARRVTDWLLANGVAAGKFKDTMTKMPDGSRGTGTTNYVVFDDSKIRIKSKKAEESMRVGKDSRGYFVLAEMDGEFYKLYSSKKGVAKFSQVLKANPYHDEKGRFATKDKHSFMSNGAAFEKTIAKAKDALKAAEKKVQEKEYVLVKQENTALNDYDTQMSDASHPEWSKLSKDQMRAINQYTGFESGDMNMYCSNAHKKISGGDEARLDQLSAYCRDMDDAANKCSLPADTILYRAMNINRLGNVSHLGAFGSGSTKAELESLIGEAFLDKGYGSASTELKTANFFRDSNRPIFAIKAPAGTKGLWVGSDHLPQTGPDHTKLARSGTGSEHEFIMQRNRAYKVVGVEEHLMPSSAWPDPDGNPIPMKKVNVVVVEVLNPTMPVEVGKWGL